MALKVEVTKIPDTNSNHVLSYEEQKFNGQTGKQNIRRFIVPEDKTDEFVTKYTKTENTSLTAKALSGLAGFFGLGGIALHVRKNSPKLYYWEVPFCAAIGGFCIGAVISSLITNLYEKKLMERYNVSEIKVAK